MPSSRQTPLNVKIFNVQEKLKAHQANEERNEEESKDVMFRFKRNHNEEMCTRCVTNNLTTSWSKSVPIM
ncbi:CLUMA_CG019376, isoform A [Clunio marinus]|uniref:CLUMA_CG019376, isoform A n=1 Tax=Clunio marinus TaxID=568069 RepID=A0A1J1J0H9_9DIPT|nr:CLUMA_CG019376, isoform A [Clunio marinus]